MKETVLTSEELGEYAANYTRTCTADNITNGKYGCTTEGETVIEKRDKISYYWSDTCHNIGYYGYTDWAGSGCTGHNDYEGSKVREFLEGNYVNTLGIENLKEVDGYKIRLITLVELQTNLGYATELTSSFYKYSSDNTPKWVYQNYGAGGYWTMTPNTTSSSQVWYIGGNGDVGSNNVYDINYGIRPVINLLKSSI